MVQDIVITSFDLARLQRQIETLEQSESSSQDLQYIIKLKSELSKAAVVAPEQIPNNVITMNSRVRLEDIDTKRQLEYTLVFPEEANSADRKVSILAPLGTALIGYRVNDTIEFKAPAGLRRLRVIGIIYQPEASGDFTV